MSATPEILQIGRINAAHGLKGWVKVYSYTDPVEQILSYSPWLLKRRGEVVEIEVAKGRVQGKGIVALLKDIEDRTQAEKLIGYDIFIEQAKLPVLEQDDYYWRQLEGLLVVNSAGSEFGRVDHLMETGANDVLVVRPEATSIDDKERLIPFVLGSVIEKVDLEAARIVVNWQADF